MRRLRRVARRKRGRTGSGWLQCTRWPPGEKKFRRSRRVRYPLHFPGCGRETGYACVYVPSQEKRTLQPSLIHGKCTPFPRMCADICFLESSLRNGDSAVPPQSISFGGLRIPMSPVRLFLFGFMPMRSRLCGHGCVLDIKWSKTNDALDGRVSPVKRAFNLRVLAFLSFPLQKL